MSELSDKRKRELNQPPKSNYELRKNSNARYNAKFEPVRIQLPKGERELWKVFAEQCDTSVQRLIVDSIHARMESAGFDYTVPKEGTDE